MFLLHRLVHAAGAGEDPDTIAPGLQLVVQAVYLFQVVFDQKYQPLGLLARARKNRVGADIRSSGPAKLSEVFNEFGVRLLDAAAQLVVVGRLVPTQQLVLQADGVFAECVEAVAAAGTGDTMHLLFKVVHRRFGPIARGDGLPGTL